MTLPAAPGLPAPPAPAPPGYDPSLFPHRVRVVSTVEVTNARGGVRAVPGTPGPTLICLLEPSGPSRQPAGPPTPGAAQVSVISLTAYFPTDPGVAAGAALQGLGDWAGRTLLAAGPARPDGPGLWACMLEEKR